MASKLVSEAKRQNLADTLHFKEGYFHYKGLPTTPGDVLTIADTFGQIKLAPGGGGGGGGDGIREWSHYLVCLPTDLPFAEYPAGSPAPSPPVYSGPNSINDAIVAANAAYVATGNPQLVLIRPGVYVQNVTWLEGVALRGTVADLVMYSGDNSSPCIIQGTVSVNVANVVGMNMQAIMIEAPSGQAALELLPNNQSLVGCKDCTFFKIDNQSNYLINIGGQINTSVNFDNCIFLATQVNVLHTYGGNPLAVRNVRFFNCLLSGNVDLAPAANMSEDFQFFRCIFTPSTLATFNVTQTSGNFGETSIDFWECYFATTAFNSLANGAQPGTSSITKSYYNCIFETCLWDEATANTGANVVQNLFYGSTLTGVDKFGTVGNCNSIFFNSTIKTTFQSNWTTTGGILFFENSQLLMRTGVDNQIILDCNDTEITLLNCNVIGSLVNNSTFLFVQSSTGNSNSCSLMNNTISLQGSVGLQRAYVMRINEPFDAAFNYTVQVCNNVIRDYGSLFIFCPLQDLKFTGNTLEGSGVGTLAADLVRMGSARTSTVSNNVFQSMDVQFDGVTVPQLKTRFSNNQVRGLFTILGRVDDAYIASNYFDYFDANGDSVQLGVPGADGNSFITFTNNTTSDHVFVYVGNGLVSTFLAMENNSLSVNFTNPGAPVVRIGNMNNLVGAGADLRFFNNVYTIGGGNPTIDTTNGPMAQQIQSRQNISYPSGTGVNVANITIAAFTGIVQ